MNQVIEKENIENLIYEIRGKQVMIDSDLARLYECVNGTKTINQAVNRHLERFPKDFYFQLTKTEYEELRSQIGTTKLNTMSRTLPYAFTEQGIAMLAKVTIITKKNNLLTEKDVEIYNKQYNNLKVIYSSTFHDRYFIIDNKTVYHCGTSINRIGHKTFSINLLSDKEVTTPLINKINRIKQKH